MQPEQAYERLLEMHGQRDNDAFVESLAYASVTYADAHGETVVIDPDCDKRIPGAIRFQRERQPVEGRLMQRINRVANTAIDSLFDAKVRRTQ